MECIRRLLVCCLFAARQSRQLAYGGLALYRLNRHEADEERQSALQRAPRPGREYLH